MAGSTAQASRIWALVARQHGVVARWQLLELGVSSRAIEHRLATGRLYSIHRGVYAVGRRELTREGWWMAAVLSCGPGAALSHGSAAALWGFGAERAGEVEISVPAPRAPRRPGVRVHRRTRLIEEDLAIRDHIPLTSPTRTLLDLTPRLGRNRLETAINELDTLDLLTPEALRAELGHYAGEPGVALLRAVLDRHTFTLTDSELERLLRPIVRRAGLPLPETGRRLNGFRVDFVWPGLGLVVETDGLRYHRTPAKQARDRIRDQAHTVAGLVPLRFTHAQIKHDPSHVLATLAAVASRITSAS